LEGRGKIGKSGTSELLSETLSADCGKISYKCFEFPHSRRESLNFDFNCFVLGHIVRMTLNASF